MIRFIIALCFRFHRPYSGVPTTGPPQRSACFTEVKIIMRVVNLYKKINVYIKKLPLAHLQPNGCTALPTAYGLL